MKWRCSDCYLPTVGVLAVLPGCLGCRHGLVRPGDEGTVTLRTCTFTHKTNPHEPAHLTESRVGYRIIRRALSGAAEEVAKLQLEAKCFTRPQGHADGGRQVGDVDFHRAGCAGPRYCARDSRGGNNRQLLPLDLRND